MVLEAAKKLIAERGYSGTSVDDVIRASGLCGKGHFYHYFRSKEELGYAVLEHELERFSERGLAILREPMIDPLQRLSLFIDHLVLSQAERGCKGGSCLGTLAAELADSHEGFRQRIELVFEQWQRQLVSLLQEAQPVMRDDTDTERLARFIVATLEGAVLMSRVTREVAGLQGIATDLKRFIAMHVREANDAAARAGSPALVSGRF